jgi:hypothetical protein
MLGILGDRKVRCNLAFDRSRGWPATMRDEYSRTPLQANRTWNSSAVARFNMQICSFLPSATEILYALGLEKSVAGVTFECDFPPEAATKTVVVNSNLSPTTSSRFIVHFVPGDGRWRHRSFVERGGLGSPLGILRAAEGRKSRINEPQGSRAQQRNQWIPSRHGGPPFLMFFT